jgi:hypothetical protein
MSVFSEMGFGSEVAGVHPTIRHPRRTSMKRNRLWAAASLSLGLALGTVLFNPVLRAQSQTAPAGQEDQQKTQVFVGKIIKVNDGRFALVTDEQAGKGVYLDDQEKAKGFEGKNVKVTGVLEIAKNLVHVSDIQLA